MDDGMDKDLAQKLNDLLSSPDSMQKIQAAMSRRRRKRKRKAPRRAAWIWRPCPICSGR